MTLHVKTRRPGFSLIELAAAITVLSLLLSIIATLIWGTVRIERAEAASFQRSITISSLADQFRADVSGADGAPGQLDRFTAGPHCLILQKGIGDAVIYRWTNKRLERIHKTDGEVSYQFLTVPDEMAVVEFATATAGPGVLELMLRPENPVPGRRPVHIRAALGGNLR